MRIELNFKSGKPPYLQILDQVKYATASGTLRQGDQLPSIRELAEQLRINRNTVAKAYNELEHEGVVETRQGRGVFVSGNASPYKKRVRDNILIDAVDAAIVQAHHFKVSDDDMVELVRQRLADFHRRRNES